jgi:hypothetical protein
MKTTDARMLFRLLSVGMLFILAAPAAHALGLQIPQIDGCTKAQGTAENATVKIAARADAQHSGEFVVAGKVSCSPPNYAGGQMQMKIDMSDSQIQGTVLFTTYDYVVATGKHTPTIYLSGQCKADGIVGCRYWLFMTDNGTPGADKLDVAGFLILDGNGQRAAYGTGVLSRGEIKVSPAP